LRAGGNASCETPGVSYDHDFIVEIPSQVQGFINIGGIESPGLTSSPAIAQRVVDLLRDASEPLIEKREWNPIRPARPCFRHMTNADRKKWVEKDSRYGRIVCRCVNVTEGEIVAEIHSLVPARTYDAIKTAHLAGNRALPGWI